MQPLISVIIPVYNVRDYLCRCVNSILRQTYDNLEVILIDDGSDDGSSELCDTLATLDVRIIVVHKLNGGQASARNIGLDMAKGDYISFIDSDDEIGPVILYEKLIESMRISAVDFIQFPFIKDGIKYNDSGVVDITNHDEMYGLWLQGKRITNYLCDKIWRAELFKDVRIKEGMIFEDRYIFVDLLNICSRIRLIDFGEYLYRIRPGQTTQRKHDEFYLKSMIMADIHIIDRMPDHLSGLRNFVRKRMFCTFIELMPMKPEKKIIRIVWKYLPPLNYVLRHVLEIPRMLLFKVLGSGLYPKFF